jgi:hypothetical protein
MNCDGPLSSFFARKLAKGGGIDIHHHEPNVRANRKFIDTVFLFSQAIDPCRNTIDVLRDF